MERILFKFQLIRSICFNFPILVIGFMFSPLLAQQNEVAWQPVVENQKGLLHPAQSDDIYKANHYLPNSPAINKHRNIIVNENSFFSIGSSSSNTTLFGDRKQDTNKEARHNLPVLSSENNCCQPKGTTEADPLRALQFLASKDLNNITLDKIKTEATGKVKSMAKNYFLTPLQQKTQTLLGKFGQAQFNLAVDDRGRFNKSSVSLFTPWYDNPHQLLFSQMGIHDQQGRMITHLGIGQRIDMPDNRWRWGYNFFFDYDWSRSHRRMGMGLETSMDYLKFAANYYHPLSNWRDSADVEDYLERPARGFDIRGQGYLPAYPQLGASLKYEQYFGDAVGLFGFGKNQRQQDPRAVNLGLNYTPFPLATINVNHKQGQQRQKETQFGLTLNYQWGVTLQQQLDPTKVGTSRSLTGNRFDLVDRNYDIVLEYKEKQVISVDLPPVTPGLIEGDSYIMQPLVKTKYPITKIRWLGDVVPLSLVATAGSLNPQGWKITLPTWRPESEDSNTYQLAIELTDKKGNTAISNNLHILNGHNRKGKLSVIGDNKAPASGIVADAIQVKINVQDYKGNTVQLKGIKPTWYVVDKDGKRVPVVTEKRCPKNSNGMRLPCIRVIEPNQPEANEYVVKVVSSLHGSFELAASLADYGESNRLSLLFVATNSTEDVRIVILDPKGSNLLKTGDTPLVGKAYEAKFYAKNDEDITEQIPPDHIRWLLHGENSECGASGASLNNHDTGVRGYTFTPRESHESNTGLTCGDQGFKIRVTY